MSNLTAAQIAVAGVRAAKAQAEVRGRQQPREADDLDHGPTGPAAVARPSEVVTIEGRARGSVATERITVRRYQDADPWAHYERASFLTERQVHAGRDLTKLYQAGYAPMMALPSYGAGGGSGLSDEEDASRSQARRDYNRLADRIPHKCRHAMACMVRMEFPIMANRIAYVREACDVLADAMDLPRVGT